MMVCGLLDATVVGWLNKWMNMKDRGWMDEGMDGRVR